MWSEKDIKTTDLLKQIEQLKKDSIQTTSLLNQNLSFYLNTDRTEHIKKLIEDYLHDAINEISILNVADAATVFKLFKELLGECDPEALGKITCAKSLKDSKHKPLRIVKDPLYRKISSLSLTSSKSRRASTRRSISKPRAAILLQQDDTKTLSPTTNKNTSVKGKNVQESSTFLLLQNQFKSLRKTDKDSRSFPKISKKSSILTAPSEQSVNHIKSYISSSTFATQNVPSNSKLWDQYCNNSQYESLHKNIKDNEHNFKLTRADYLDEMNILFELIDFVEDIKNDMNETKLFKHFNELFTTDGVNGRVFNEAESICKNRLDDAVKNIQQQKKKVLELQTLLRSLVDERRTLKEELSNNFEKFCMKTT